MPPQRKKNFRRGCQPHCRVWFASGTTFMISCAHCLHQFDRMDEVERPAEWCERQARMTQDAHRRLCERMTRSSRAA